MSSFLFLGAPFERRHGTVQTIHLVNVFVLLNAALYLGLSAIPLYAGSGTSWATYLLGCTIGFSGVVFSFITAFVLGPGAPSHISIYGLLNVPSRWYPLVLLVLLQMLRVRVSLLGHLSGLISGCLCKSMCLWLVWTQNPCTAQVLVAR